LTPWLPFLPHANVPTLVSHDSDRPPSGNPSLRLGKTIFSPVEPPSLSSHSHVVFFGFFFFTSYVFQPLDPPSFPGPFPNELPPSVFTKPAFACVASASLLCLSYLSFPPPQSFSSSEQGLEISLTNFLFFPLGNGS